MAKTIISKGEFTDLADLAEDNYCTADPDYSGRGMFGATCLSFAGSEGDLAALVAAVAEEGGALADLLEGKPSTDSLGLRSVWYWRHVQVQGHVRASQF